MSDQHPVKIDLAESFPHLVRAPIVEAVIDVRALCASPVEEKTAMASLRVQLPDYPTIVSQSEVRQEIKPGNGAAESRMADLRWKGLRFASVDKLHVAQFNRDGFVFSRLQPYEGWEQFTREFERLWAMYRELGRVVDVQRIGLRFINRLQMEQGETNFESYIEPSPLPPKGLKLPFVSYFHQDVLLATGHPYMVNIIKTIQPPLDPAVQGFALLLDIDAYTLQNFVAPPENLQRHLLEMRWLKNRAFFGSITETVAEKYRHDN